MKKQQWNGVKTKCASSQSVISNWTAIEWNKCEHRLKKLQARIVKAQQEKRYGKVKYLQRILVTSFDAKALAVKRVTSNKGKRTAGVDKIKWTSSEAGRSRKALKVLRPESFINFFGLRFAKIVELV